MIPSNEIISTERTTPKNTVTAEIPDYAHPYEKNQKSRYLIPASNHNRKIEPSIIKMQDKKYAKQQKSKPNLYITGNRGQKIPLRSVMNKVNKNNVYKQPLNHNSKGRQKSTPNKYETGDRGKKLKAMYQNNNIKQRYNGHEYNIPLPNECTCILTWTECIFGVKIMTENCIYQQTGNLCRKNRWEEKCSNANDHGQQKTIQKLYKTGNQGQKIPIQTAINKVSENDVFKQPLYYNSYENEHNIPSQNECKCILNWTKCFRGVKIMTENCAYKQTGNFCRENIWEEKC